MLNVLSVFTRTLSMADCVDMPSIAENAAKHVMEHALLNDESEYSRYKGRRISWNIDLEGQIVCPSDIVVVQRKSGFSCNWIIRYLFELVLQPLTHIVIWNIQITCLRTYISTWLIQLHFSPVSWLVVTELTLQVMTKCGVVKSNS